jgi:hypothetical protein
MRIMPRAKSCRVPAVDQASNYGEIAYCLPETFWSRSASHTSLKRAVNERLIGARHTPEKPG